MARILVSGAGGYVGIPLCAALVAGGHEVLALDRFFFGKERLQDHVGPGCRLVVADLRRFDPAILEGVDTVIDLAGLSNDATAEIDPDLTRAINCEGGIRLADAAKSAGVRRYVYSSSASVYGYGVHDHLHEESPCRPQTLYAESKLRVEERLAALVSPDFETVILRNATVFGLAPRMRLDLAINIMTYRAWKDRVVYIMGGGEQWRPFIHVNDVVRAMILAFESDRSLVAGRTFNVGGDDMNFQIKQLAQFVLDVIPNTQIHRIPDDPDKRTYNLSFERIHQELGFKPSVRVHEGIVEVKQALERGRLSGDDPTCYTLQWYKSLIDWERRIAELALDGRVF